MRQDGEVGVKLLSNAVARLEGDKLVCRLHHNVDVGLLTDVICELAALLPDAVARDDEGNVLDGRAPGTVVRA